MSTINSLTTSLTTSTPSLTSLLNLSFSDIEHTQKTASYCVTQWTVMSLTGRDVTDLTHRVLTLNTHLLGNGTGNRAFLLDSRGRVKYAFWLLRESSERCYIVYDHVHDGALNKLLDALDMFIFSEDVKLEIESLNCVYYWGESEITDSAKTTQETELPSFNVACYGAINEGVYLIQDEDLITLHEQFSYRKYLQVSPLYLEGLRIGWGAPNFLEYHEGVSPLDVSGEGIYQDKGCYPGQEVIERTLALGKPALCTMLVKLEGNSEQIALLQTKFKTDEQIQVMMIEDKVDPPITKSVGSLTSLVILKDGGVGIVQIKQSARDLKLKVNLSDKATSKQFMALQMIRSLYE